MKHNLSANYFPTYEDAKGLLSEWGKKNQKLVFTNGCFDILHRGHLSYLFEAKCLGDKLVIGLNSDASVLRLKGKGRPIKSAFDRGVILSILSFVDAVIQFESDTPLELIESIGPMMLVKGGDWAIEKIVGSDFVKSIGGEVRSIAFVEGYSSTNYINKIENKS